MQAGWKAHENSHLTKFQDVNKSCGHTGKMLQQRHVGLAGLHHQATSTARRSISAAVGRVSTDKH